MTKKPTPIKTELSPLYLKIGKRIRQARLTAKETNSRALSLRLGWSAGRLNNFETGISTPGIEETMAFCDAVKANPVWITYGEGSPRTTTQKTVRHRNLLALTDDAQARGELSELLNAINLSPDRLETLRAHPLKKIPDLVARRCEKYLKKPRGWMDEAKAQESVVLTPGMRAVLAVYAGLAVEDQRRFYRIGRVLLDEKEDC